jgi:hypothetical protein
VTRSEFIQRAALQFYANLRTHGEAGKPAMIVAIAEARELANLLEDDIESHFNDEEITQ